jgi:hypothetical protein
MTTEIEFAKAIEIIATDLGVAAEQIFAIFVSAQVMIGIIDIVSIIAMSGVAYLSVKYVQEHCISIFKDKDGNWNNDMDMAAGYIVPIIAGIFTLALASVFTEFIGDALLKIACPEYTAMREILNLVT